MVKHFVIYIFAVFSLLIGDGCDGLGTGDEPSPEYMKAAEVLARDRRAAAAEERGVLEKEKVREAKQREHEIEVMQAKKFEQHQKEIDPYFVSNAEVRTIESKEIRKGEKEQEEEEEHEEKAQKQRQEQAKTQKEEALEDRADDKFRQWYLRSNKGHLTNAELQ